jgi:hypothetical protein
LYRRRRKILSLQSFPTFPIRTLTRSTFRPYDASLAAVSALAYVPRKNALAGNKAVGIPAIRFFVVMFILFLFLISLTP